MLYYKPTLFSSKLLYRRLYGIFVYKPTLFIADVTEIAHGLIIRTIRYTNIIWLAN